MSVRRVLPVLMLILGLFAGAGCTSDEGDLEFSETDQEVALPAPTGVVATAISPTRIDLSWTATPGAARYVVYRGPAPGSLTTLTSTLNPTFVNNYLTPGTQYCFAVRNINNLNEASTYSATVCTTTPLSSTTHAPAGVVATAVSSANIEVTWAAVAGVSGYYIHQATGAAPLAYVSSVAAPTTRYVAGNLRSEEH